MASQRSLLSVSGPAVYKQRAIQEAEQQQKVIDEKLKRSGDPPSKYQFRELIGKGAYGRVYKSYHIESGSILAVKVLETDAMDFDAKSQNKDGGIEDAMKEINILRRLRDSNAVNVNQFLEAFQVHSQLWIVSEYCSGGSLTTLRRATGNVLTERYLVPIARELAAGLRSVHEAGIIHRDIKSSNVMIDETGRLQIIDFGVAGILLSNLDVDKRKTVIGTPHWMAPELQANAAEIAHGTEVDVWAYGITLYECATGAPPNARTLPGRQLKSQIRQNPTPRLPEKFSLELQDLNEFVLDPDPTTRPSMEQICQHDYIKNTEGSHPTVVLRELVEQYYLWERAGGQRASLFYQGGAAKPTMSGGPVDDEEEWNFSTTANFEKIHADLDSALGLNNTDAEGDSFSNMLSSSPPRDPDDYPAKRPGSSKGQTEAELERSVARGARAMQGLFDSNASPYQYNHSAQGQSSDLPLRTGDSSSSLHRKELSVSSSNGGAPQINLKRIPSKKGKRSTMAWKWEDNLGDTNLTAPTALPDISEPPVRPVLKHAATMPIEQFNNRPISEGLLDLDALMDDGSFSTLPAASSYSVDPTASFSNDPPPEDDDDNLGFTIRQGASTAPTTAQSYAGGRHTQMSSISSFLSAEDDTTLHPPVSHSLGGQPMPHLSPSPSQPVSSRASVLYPPPIPPAALMNDAPVEVMQAAFEQVMGGWMNMLQMNLDVLGDSEEEDSEDELVSENGNGINGGDEASEWSESGFAAGGPVGASREGSVEGSSDEDVDGLGPDN